MIKLGSEVLKFFKQNPDKYYEVMEIAKILNINKQTAHSQVKKMFDKGDLIYKEIEKSDSNPKKVYAYIIKEDAVLDSLHSLTNLRQYRGLDFMREDSKLLLLLLSEIKKLREDLKNGNNN